MSSQKQFTFTFSNGKIIVTNTEDLTIEEKTVIENFNNFSESQKIDYPTVPVISHRRIEEENSSDEDIHDLVLSDYSEKSIVIRGKDTKKYKDEIKKEGGKWNSNLKDGAGWIFPKSKKDAVKKLLKNLKLNL